MRPARSGRPADGAFLLDGRARDCRPVPVNRVSVPWEWRIALSPSIQYDSNTYSGPTRCAIRFVSGLSLKVVSSRPQRAGPDRTFIGAGPECRDTYQEVTHMRFR